MESSGGTVLEYGLAASQLRRIRNSGYRPWLNMDPDPDDNYS